MSKHHKYNFLNTHEELPPAIGTVYYTPSLHPLKHTWKESSKDFSFLELNLVFLHKKDAMHVFAYRFVQ